MIPEHGNIPGSPPRKPPSESGLPLLLANRLRDNRDELSRRWLARILDRVDLDAERVFPSHDLLDHVPRLVEAIADHLEDPRADVAASGDVAEKALELGTLRHDQGFGAHEILKEFEILGGIVLKFLTGEVRELSRDPSWGPAEDAGDAFLCAHRVHRALARIQQETTAQFLRLLDEKVAERERRLRSFNRMVSHELKGWVHGALGAARALADGPDDLERKGRLLEIVSENLQAVDARLGDLLELSGTGPVPRSERHVTLPGAVAEAVRQLEGAAESVGVEVCVEPDLPEVEVDSALVELCLVNYLSNAIKYHDPSQDRRWVAVTGSLRGDPDDGQELVVEVRDNGLGVPEELRPRLFTRFFRAHPERPGVDGSGLGLSIVHETVEAAGGRAWAEFPDDGGAVFAFALPAAGASNGGSNAEFRPSRGP